MVLLLVWGFMFGAPVAGCFWKHGLAVGIANATKENAMAWQLPCHGV